MKQYAHGSLPSLPILLRTNDISSLFPSRFLGFRTLSLSPGPPPCGYLEFASTTHCACRKRRLSSLRPPPPGAEARVFKSLPAEIKPPRSPPPAPPVRAQGYQRVPFSKPVVVQSNALHAEAAYRASTYSLPSLYLPCSFSNFIFGTIYPVFITDAVLGLNQL